MSRDSREFHAAAQAQADALQHAVKATRGIAVIDAAAIIGEQCSTCDGFMCLDCVSGSEHEECTRACPDCLIENADWDQSLEMTQIVTELRGLHALDEAIQQMEAEEQGPCEGRGGMSA